MYRRPGEDPAALLVAGLIWLTVSIFFPIFFWMGLTLIALLYAVKWILDLWSRIDNGNDRKR